MALACRRSAPRTRWPAVVDPGRGRDLLEPPWHMTTTRSESDSASSWSCVTYTAVVPSCCWIRRISSRRATRSSRRARRAARRAGAPAARWQARGRAPPAAASRPRAGAGSGTRVRPRMSSSSSATALAARPVDAAEAQPVSDVVASGHVREEAIGLEDDAHVAPIGRHPADVGPSRTMRPDVGLVEPRERPQGRGLAASAGPEERDELAALDLEREPIQCVDVPVVPVEVEQLHGDSVHRGSGRVDGGGHQGASPVTGSSADRRPVGVTLASARMRKNAKRAPRARPRRPRTRRVLPSRLMTTWTVS